jgi:hypothetical protein
MAAAWDDVGRVGNLLQLLGVDAFGLASMITQAALTAQRNRDACLQLSEHVGVVVGLLRRLQMLPRLRQHPETRRPLEQLDDALRRAYLLVRSCSQEQAATSYLYQLFTGAHTAKAARRRGGDRPLHPPHPHDQPRRHRPCRGTEYRRSVKKKICCLLLCPLSSLL